MAKSTYRSVLPVALGIAGAATGLLALVMPRVNEDVDARWEELSRYRYAHRGLHDRTVGVPENSLAAFVRAREAGYGAELDVHLTADDQLVVMHDSELFRMTGEVGVVEEKTLAELQLMRLRGSDEGIPTFDEVLALYDERDGVPAPPLVVELKSYNSNSQHLAERAMEELDRHSARYVVESFDPRCLLWLRKNRPEVIRGQLAENFLIDPGSAYLPLPVRAGLSALLGNVVSRPDFVAYRFRDRANPMVRLVCGALGAKLVTWTIRSKEALAATEAEGGVAIFEKFRPSPMREA